MSRRELRAVQNPVEDVPQHDPDALARLYTVIDECGDAGISDIHAHPGKPMWYLDRGNLRVDERRQPAVDDIDAWMNEATAGKTDPLAGRGHVFAALDSGRYRVRSTFRRSMQGVTTSFRVIPTVIPSPEKLGLPAVMVDLISRQSGLVIMEGPTGSGKTTAIASLVEKLNNDYDKHIYTAEDPIEFVYEAKGATSIIQREVGTHVESYPAAIEDALRSKPNVIVIGELLNADTARAALHAATTGHLVFTTAHAGSIPEALDGFIGQFTADEQPQVRSRLSQSLLAIMVQKLVPSTDGGLAAAREVMINDINFSEIIRDAKTHMIRAQLSGGDCFTLEDDLAALVKAGRITAETAIASAKDTAGIRQNLQRMGIAA